MAVADVKDSCMHDDEEYLCYLNYFDEQVEFTHSVDKKHENYESMERNKKVLHLILSKRLRGCFQSALL